MIPFWVRLRLFLFLGSLGLALLSLSDGQCNSCSVSSGLACVSQTEFQVCAGGTPVGVPSGCPAGYVCSTASGAICQLNQTGVIVTCGDCNVCDVNGTFACTGAQTYALCLGGTTPSNSTGSCAANYVCNIEFPQICGDVSLGIQPTCPTAGEVTPTTDTTTTTFTTVSPISFPAQYCQNVQQNGRFPVGNSIANTCRQYVYCAVNSGIWTGQLFTCPGRTYFNSTSRLCVDSVPADCI